MRRLPMLILFAVLGCGGSPKPAPAPVDDVPPAPAEPRQLPPPVPAQVREAEEKTKPPPPPEAKDMPWAAPTVSVKLVAAGKGKKSPLRLEPKAGARQQVALALDFSQKQAAPAELGGDQELTIATLIFQSELETKDVAADGRVTFMLTITAIDAKDIPGAKVTAEALKEGMKPFVGTTLAGTVGANGAPGELTFHIPKWDPIIQNAFGLVTAALLPLFPVLPAEPVGQGAKWQATTTMKIADQLDVAIVTDYQLLARGADAWTVKGTSKVTGAAQEVRGAKLDAIGGTGSIEATAKAGELLPTGTSKLSPSFTATLENPQTKQKQAAKFEFQIANAIAE